jgi:hypothetical protein
MANARVVLFYLLLIALSTVSVCGKEGISSQETDKDFTKQERKLRRIRSGIYGFGNVDVDGDALDPQSRGESLGNSSEYDDKESDVYEEHVGNQSSIPDVNQTAATVYRSNGKKQRDEDDDENGKKGGSRKGDDSGKKGGGKKGGSPTPAPTLMPTTPAPTLMPILDPTMSMMSMMSMNQKNLMSMNLKKVLQLEQDFSEQDVSEDLWDLWD